MWGRRSGYIRTESGHRSNHQERGDVIRWVEDRQSNTSSGDSRQMPTVYSRFTRKLRLSRADRRNAKNLELSRAFSKSRPGSPPLQVCQSCRDERPICECAEYGHLSNSKRGRSRCGDYSPRSQISTGPRIHSQSGLWCLP